MAELGPILQWAETELARAGCAEPRADALALVASVTGLASLQVQPIPKTPLPAGVTERIELAVTRRARREPLAYVLGTTRFRGVELRVDSRVHIPREDRSGLLVDATKTLKTGSWVHDVGTGAGAIAIAIKVERPDFIVTASDVSAEALEVARENAAHANADITFTLARGVPTGSYDLVVGCLPYAVDRTLSATHPPETARYQPRLALLAGSDGLDVIREVIDQAVSGQRLALEHAPDQADAVRALLAAPTTLVDSAGTRRVTVGTRA
jgi:release factor glutamine methyltransferase